MKKLYALILMLSLTGISQAQHCDLGDLLSFTGYSVSKFDAYIGKKSYHRDYESPHETRSNYNYIEVRKNKKKGEEVVHKLSFLEKPGAPVISYQTTSLDEFNDIRHDLRKKGFISYVAEADPMKPLLYQQENTTVATSVEIRDTLTFYTVKVEKEMLPKIRDIVHAEDLLPLKSHEYLSAVFGPANVVRDVFHYSSNDSNFCSVLFPNSPREVIFIWDDETNFRDVSFLIIGGHLMTNNNLGTSNTISSNEWQSKQGVSVGMKLEELQALNEDKLNFYGWSSEQPGVLTKSNKGKLDFNHLGVVLSCLNCLNNPAMEKYTVDSDRAVQEERKVYVSSIVIIPDKEKNKATATR
ncbi:MAG: hypothetical protein EOO15_23880 [Chitinophagaceae bacterium]|nr:MAG: hypothetical protein EOO15_23880 [Chitinophagaceae bacterium]